MDNRLVDYGFTHFDNFKVCGIIMKPEKSELDEKIEKYEKEFDTIGFGENFSGIKEKIEIEERILEKFMKWLNKNNLCDERFEWCGKFSGDIFKDPCRKLIKFTFEETAKKFEKIGINATEEGLKEGYKLGKEETAKEKDKEIKSWVKAVRAHERNKIFEKIEKIVEQHKNEIKSSDMIFIPKKDLENLKKEVKKE